MLMCRPLTRNPSGYSSVLSRLTHRIRLTRQGEEIFHRRCRNQYSRKERKRGSDSRSFCRFVAALLAIARLLYRQWRAEPAQRSRAWRIALLVLAQPLCATLLYFALLPPTTPGEAGTLVVASAGATSAQLAAGKAGDAWVALPEAPELPGVERVPDLATALRQHPGTQRVRVVGAGLEARDRDAMRGLALEFVAAALPRGLVELALPSRVVAGGEFDVAGRAERLQSGFAELHDPARQRVDRIALAADGRFALTATTRMPGAAIYRLRLRDARQQVVEDIEIPLLVEADLMLVMTHAHADWVHERLPESRGRVQLLGRWREQEIPDPYGRDRATYLRVFEQIDDCVADWLPRLA